MNINQLTPKQQLRLQNRLNNEKQRLQAQARRSSKPAPQEASGLSKGQRRRMNTQSRLGGGPRPSSSSAPVGPSQRFRGAGGAGLSFPSGRVPQLSGKPHPMVEDEYICDIYGSVGFATTGFFVNPGQTTTFPFMSKIAQRYEKYRVKSMCFYYKPLVSAFAPNGQKGKVMLSFDYDASDPLPSTKQQVEDTVPHDDALPCKECYMALVPSLLNGNRDSKYVRPGMLPASGSILDFDAGLLAVSTQGNTDTSVIGELRVFYDLDLFVPVLESTTSAPTNFRTSVYDLVAPQASDTLIDLVMTSTINPLGITAAGGSFIFPQGNYITTLQTQFDDTPGFGLTSWQTGCSADITSINYNVDSNPITTVTTTLSNYFSSSGSLVVTYSALTISADTLGQVTRARLIIQSV